MGRRRVSPRVRWACDPVVNSRGCVEVPRTKTMTGLDLESFLLLLRADLSAWVVLGLAIVGLALLTWLCWGSRRALRKCLVLSLSAHFVLVLYGSTVPSIRLAVSGDRSESFGSFAYPANPGLPSGRIGQILGGAASTVRDGSTTPPSRVPRHHLAWSWRPHPFDWPISPCVYLVRRLRIERPSIRLPILLLHSDRTATPRPSLPDPETSRDRFSC